MADKKLVTLGCGLAFVAILAPTPAWAQADGSTVAINLDIVWVLVAATLVFLMQLGFLALEVGFVRPRSVTSVAMKNTVDLIVVILAFFAVGCAFMFGRSDNGFIGGSLFFLHNIDNSPDGSPLGGAFFLFQMGFAATAATIVSGAMAGRTSFVSYLCVAVAVGAFIYPIFGHWGWGTAFFADNQSWLASLGFLDFAGSTMVHAIGGAIALVGIWILGPRIGRFDAHGNPSPMESTPFGYAWVAFGVLVLWFGWWGFNGGSTLAMNTDVPGIIINTCLAGSAAGVSSFWHARAFQNGAELNEKFLGGTLGGLVAITASCNIVSPIAAVVIGLTGGVLHNLSFDLLLKRLKLDDPVGAVPVHLVCGTWGTLCVAFFAPDAAFSGLTRWTQLAVQSAGLAACFVWCGATGYVLFRGLRATVGLRVSPEQELAGINLAGTVESPAPPPKDSFDAEELRALMEA